MEEPGTKHRELSSHSMEGFLTLCPKQGYRDSGYSLMVQVLVLIQKNQRETLYGPGSMLYRQLLSLF